MEMRAGDQIECGEIAALTNQAATTSAAALNLQPQPGANATAARSSCIENLSQPMKVITRVIKCLMVLTLSY